MPEVIKPVRTVRVTMTCDVPECGGTMVSGGHVFLTYPLKYPHTCDKCGVSTTYRIQYPTVRHEVSE